ncbi:MAG: ACT domain-containing protein, partial [Pseudomonadota bacterium]
CPELEAYENDLDRWLDLRWAPDADRFATNLARVELILANRPGTLGQVCSLVGEQQANIDNLGVLNRKPDFFRMTMDLEVRDLRHLNDILTALQAQGFVTYAGRARADQVAVPAEPEQPRLPLGKMMGAAQG